MRIYFAFLFLLNITAVANANIKSEEINYTSNGISMKGFLIYNDFIKIKRPGILVVHEWWGHNEYSRVRAKMLAKIGYTAFAIDMYGDGKTASHPKLANKYMQKIFENWDESKKRFLKAMKILRAHKTVDPEKIAAIGYCFGGAVAIKMARSGADLNGVVAFHSSLPLEPIVTKGKIKAAILVANGSKDSFLNSKDVASFMKQMYEANADLTYLNLTGIRHSYTNPMADELSKNFNIPNLKYNEKADKRSWMEMIRFFDRILN